MLPNKVVGRESGLSERPACVCTMTKHIAIFRVGGNYYGGKLISDSHYSAQRICFFSTERRQKYKMLPSWMKSKCFFGLSAVATLVVAGYMYVLFEKGKLVAWTIVPFDDIASVILS